jgi:hypothetical protein
MMGAPSRVTDRQLKDLGIKVVENPNKPSTA